MNDDLVLGRINRWNSPTRNHVMKIRRCDRPIELVQWREGGDRRRRQAGRMLERRTHADRSRWWSRYFGRIIRHGRRGYLACRSIGKGQCPGSGYRASQQDPAAEARATPPTRNRLILASHCCCSSPLTRTSRETRDRASLKHADRAVSGEIAT